MRIGQKPVDKIVCIQNMVTGFDLLNRFPSFVIILQQKALEIAGIIMYIYVNIFTHIYCTHVYIYIHI